MARRFRAWSRVWFRAQRQIHDRCPPASFISRTGPSTGQAIEGKRRLAAELDSSLESLALDEADQTLHERDSLGDAIVFEGHYGWLNERPGKEDDRLRAGTRDGDV